MGGEALTGELGGRGWLVGRGSGPGAFRTVPVMRAVASSRSRRPAGRPGPVLRGWPAVDFYDCSADAGLELTWRARTRS